MPAVKLFPFAGSVIILITPPIASLPYKLDDGPFTISILRILPTANLDKSITPP